MHNNPEKEDIWIPKYIGGGVQVHGTILSKKFVVGVYGVVTLSVLTAVTTQSVGTSKGGLRGLSSCIIMLAGNGQAGQTQNDVTRHAHTNRIIPWYV